MSQASRGDREGLGSERTKSAKRNEWQVSRPTRSESDSPLPANSGLPCGPVGRSA
jgi:hypothetical protein